MINKEISEKESERAGIKKGRGKNRWNEVNKNSEGRERWKRRRKYDL